MSVGPITSRVRENFIDGRLSVDLLPGVTVITAPDIMAVPEVASPSYARITLDPSEEFGEPEVVTVTEHTLGSDTLTCVRGVETSAEREHPATTEWRLAMTQDDFQQIEELVDSSLTVINTDLAALNTEVDVLTSSVGAADTTLNALITAMQAQITQLLLDQPRGLVASDTTPQQAYLETSGAGIDVYSVAYTVVNGPRLILATGGGAWQHVSPGVPATPVWGPGGTTFHSPPGGATVSLTVSPTDTGGPYEVTGNTRGDFGTGHDTYGMVFEATPTLLLELANGAHTFKISIRRITGSLSDARIFAFGGENLRVYDMGRAV